MKLNTIHSQLILLVLSTTILIPIGINSLHAHTQEPSTPLISETASESAQVQLARYLTHRGVQMFGAYWCPHCQHQKARFGTDAFQIIDYIECDPRGENARPQLCQDEKIEGFPTWKIDGQLYPGDRSLEELADLSGYPGPRNFASNPP